MAQDSEEDKVNKDKGSTTGEVGGRYLGKKVAAGAAARAGGSAAGSAAGTAAGTGAGTAAGAGAGAAAGAGAGAGGGAAAGAGTGAAAGAAGGPLAPATVPAGAIAGTLAGVAGGAIGGKAVEKTKKDPIKIFIVCGGCVVGLLAVPFIVIIFFIMLIIAGAGGAGVAEGSEVGNPLSVEKTADPSVLDIGDPGQTTYTIKIKNNTGSEATNVTLTDEFSGTHAAAVTSNCGMDVGNIPAGDDVTKTCEASNINTSEDWILSNTVNVSASVVVGSASSGELNYYIPFKDTTDLPDSDAVNNAAEQFTETNIRQLQTVIDRSISSGVNPSLTIAIWWEEGAFGGVNQSGDRADTEFGCGGPSSFTQSLECFLNFTAAHTWDPNDPYGSFRTWVHDYCAPNRPLCDNKPNFIPDLESTYTTVSADPRIVYVSPATSDPDFASCFNFTGSWGPGEQDIVAQAISVPGAYSSWLGLVCDGGPVNLERVRNSTAGITADVLGGNPLGRHMRIYNPFFGIDIPLATNADGRAFVMAHELTHVIQSVRSDIFDDYQADPGVSQEFADKFVIRSYPLCDSATQTCQGVTAWNEDFAEAAAGFIGSREGVSPPLSLQSEYPEHFRFVKDKLYGGQAPPSGGVRQTVTVTATATVCIGDAECGGQPIYSPLRGSVTASGNSYNPPGHDGLDIASNDYTVLSPFPGQATVTFAGGDPARRCPSYGLYILIQSGEWEALLSHENELYVTGSTEVDTNTPLGNMDNTGCSEGDHVHYELRRNGELVDPNDYGALIPHP